jgi:phosphoribosylformylglycinamidine synthase
VSRPSALVVQAPGTNRDGDVALALELAGAAPRIVLLGDLLTRPALLRDARLLVLSGGFSHADALGAGRMFGLRLALGLGDLLSGFVAEGRPVLGICNGFQTLVRAGLLPGAGHHAALGPNAQGHFECRWVRLRAVSARCVWTAGLGRSGDPELHCPIAHGEGRFTCDDATLAALRAADQIALTYASPNPNGSVADIAGICDPTGVVLGLMPHPENHVTARQHPLARRGGGRGLGLRLFEQGVRHAREL